ncbi:MAG: DNA polymerase IV, partial [Actinobacteria bacterium]|nr:DNA polymerase IV [Actinomycetota bacterium]
MNCFYANVEALYHPELRDKPLAVGGSAEARHGIILAKNQIAKGFGIKTGEALWQAREKCPSLVILPPNYELYLKFSRLARLIYYDYADLVEPFGPDEAWLDCTHSVELFGGNPL